jgi:hypothetical protein
MSVELDFEIVGGDFSQATPVFEVPPLRRPQESNVSLTQLAGACTTVGGRIKPDRDVARVEREGRGRDGVAARSSTLAAHGRKPTAEIAPIRASLTK